MTVFYDLLFDIVPIVSVLFFFQLVVLKRKIANIRNILFGLCLVWLGLSFFLLGLDLSLFPIGELVAKQLTSNDFIGEIRNWKSYAWVYVFAFLIGFSTTIAEPALLAIAQKAEMASGKAIRQNHLRIAVALGVAVGITLGCYRIVAKLPIEYFIIMGYCFVLLQTLVTPKDMMALAYDLGGVTTSTVTVPIVTALGIGLSSSLAHSNPLLDGFGLIAFGSLFPIISVLFYVRLIKF